MLMKYESKLGKSDTKGKSTRTIVPKEVMQFLNLEWGDKLVWTVNIEGKDEVTVCISPKKDEKQE